MATLIFIYLFILTEDIVSLISSEELQHPLLVSLNSSHLRIVPSLNSPESGTPLENAIHLLLSGPRLVQKGCPNFLLEL